LNRSGTAAQANVTRTLWGAIKQVLLIPFRMLKFILKIGLLLLLLYLGYEAWDYFKAAHQFSSTGHCAIVHESLEPIRDDFSGPVTCIDATPQDPSLVRSLESVNFVIFAASELEPTFDQHGHSWTLFVSAQNGEPPVIQEYYSIGFGAAQGQKPFPPWMQRIYENTRDWIPAQLRPVTNRLISYLNRNMKSQDGELPAVAPGTKLDTNWLSRIRNSAFGLEAKADTLLIVETSQVQYEEAKEVARKFSETTYHVGLNDCSSYLLQVASTVGLYTPPRPLNLFPSDVVLSLEKYNIQMD